ncbi:hypothetical protein [Sphingobium vermicomposti]|uniref:Uncharacterized protein n=1 Tax=Sphingobium vermicomposti TaxID=529005 RepID=A0A846M6K3_9SPHN|nr:hypothetical protein [Sphingobium vermicomposti]NIJ16271.1 hypothetical protein [Sphingobium vermicomposti]
MTTKKSTRSSSPRSSRKATRPPSARCAPLNVIHLHNYLKATRHLCDAKRRRHVFIFDIAQTIGTNVRKADFDVPLRAELNFMLT